MIASLKIVVLPVAKCEVPVAKGAVHCVGLLFPATNGTAILFLD